MIRLALLPLIAMSTMACTPKDGPEPQKPPVAGEPGKCSTDGLSHLLGQSNSEKLVADAKRISGARAVRVITPDMAVTMDYREDRLNIHLGTEGKVGSFKCG